MNLCIYLYLCLLLVLLACIPVFERVPVYIYIMFVSVCVSLYMSVSSGAPRRLCTSDFLLVCMSVYV